MNLGVYSFLSIGVILVAVIGALPALAAHLCFLRRLRLAHPALWAAYRQIAFRPTHSSVKNRELSARVYPQITDASVIKARQRDLLFRRLFACSIFVTALPFTLWCIFTALN